MSFNYNNLIRRIEAFAALSEDEKTPVKDMPMVDFTSLYRALSRDLRMIIAELGQDAMVLKHQGFEKHMLGRLMDVQRDLFNLLMAAKEQSDNAMLLARGITDYATKPILRELRTAIKHHLAVHHVEHTPHLLLMEARIEGLENLERLADKIRNNYGVF